MSSVRAAPDPSRQATLGAAFSATGKGLHTGRVSTVRISPAPPGHGILFRVQTAGGACEIRPGWETRVPSRLNTALGLPGGGKLRTVEHLLSALAALRIDNATVEVSGMEIPILDASARGWCEKILAAGAVAQDEPRRSIRIVRPFQVRYFDGFVRAEPHDGFFVDLTTDHPAAYGIVGWSGEVDAETYLREIAPARSFADLAALWRQVLRRSGTAKLFGARIHQRLLAQAYGLKPASGTGRRANEPRPDCAGAALTDVRPPVDPQDREPILRGAGPGRGTLVIGRTILGGARFPDEPVRHKVLDLIGDLTLAGAPILGRIVAHRPTHELMHAFVSRLMQDSESWTVERPEAESSTAT